MAHIWVRAEQRAFEQRVGLTPAGAATLLAAGHQVTVEESSMRAISLDGFADAGCAIAAEHSWTDTPKDTIIFGLKEFLSCNSLQLLQNIISKDPLGIF